MASNIETTFITASDLNVASGTRILKWLLVSAAATGGAWQINDSTDDTGTDRLSGVAPANSMTFLGPLNLELRGGIFADIPGTNVTLSGGYS
jgi:hypothetical protein